jgi:FkbH-like protein
MVNSDQQALEVLQRDDAAQFELMAALSWLDNSESPMRRMKAGIAANVSVDLLGTFLRRHAYLAGVRLLVAKGSYDDLLGDVQSHHAAGVELLLVLPFFDNLQAAWESRLENLPEEDCQALQSDYLSRLELALRAAQGISQVLVLGAHLFNPRVASSSRQQRALDSFNAGLLEVVARHAHARVLETEGLLSRFGGLHAFDQRFYYRGKAPYAVGFIDHLSRQVALATRGFGSTFYKVLVLDCDNTLWGGIVGEDGPAGIKLDPYAYPGNIFWTVQQHVRTLEANGVLVCLCSKNNLADVDEVLGSHPSMVLRDAQVLVKKVNWQDKPSNLRALATELNLGLESFVFIDDSDFEVQAVRDQLPQVKVFQVPKSLQDYPALMRDQVLPLFLAAGNSAETREKTQAYRRLADASKLQASFSNHEEYLRSLRLVVSMQQALPNQVPRIAELIGKSNQFNLTTQRLSPGDVTALMARADVCVYAFSVKDRLAEHGLVGVLITQDESDAVVVKSFLMSCRVIGRGVEFSVWQGVVADAKARGMHSLVAEYRPTAKNSQVADFYDRLGLTRSVDAGDGTRAYVADLVSLPLTDCPWVELRYA